MEDENVLHQLLRKVAGPDETINSHTNKLSMEELVDYLRNILREKSYLVVLDDVWRREALEEILPAFPQDLTNRGSKVIITTRNREIIQLPNLQQSLCCIHEPRPLSEEEGWELLSKLALHHHENRNVDAFKTLGKDMLKKCGGLPLAIAALAGILNTRGSIAEWQQVNEAVRSRVMEGMQTHRGRSVHDLLALSYDDLHDDLKPCFNYLCVFPEDCQIPVGMLIRMWISEGLVTPHQELSLEDVAMQYLEELSHRFMIKIARINFKGAIKTIHIHDLLRDLCVRKAKEENLFQIYSDKITQTTNYGFSPVIKSRKVALHSSISFPTQESNLRSLVLLTRSSILPSAYDSKETVELSVVSKSFKLLRLLNIWGIKTATGTLPTEIGCLVHLRYLGVRVSNITELPSSIGKLRNLLTLDYRDVDSENNVEIPNVLCKLVLLKHLYLPMECPWIIQKLQLSGLTNLQTLWGVKCTRSGILVSDWFSSEMLELSKTLKKLKVIVSTRKDLEASFRCPSLISDRLQTFHCELRDGLVLEQINPISHNKHLHKLVLIGPIRLDSKLSLLLPLNLVILKLRDSIIQAGEDPMGAIGSLTHLKLLELSNFYLGTEFLCKEGSFPVLEELFLENIPNLNMWKIQDGAMASLKKIEILWCKKLVHFPQGLAFVTTLQQFEFFGMSQEFGVGAQLSGWSRKGLKLPQNMAATIDQCDSPLDISTITKLYQQLTFGVFLNNKGQKYWVIKQDDKFYNCFILYATHLSLCKTGSLGDYYPGFLRPLDNCWEWNEEEESDGSLTTVGKVTCLHGLTLHGEFDIKYLSPEATYEISYMMMLPSDFPEGKLCFMRANFSVCGESHSSMKRISVDQPLNEWIKVCVGQINTTFSGNRGLISFALEGVLYGAHIQGVIIKPKLEARDFDQFMSDSYHSRELIYAR